jgi:hypothetical protein
VIDIEEIEPIQGTKFNLHFNAGNIATELLSAITKTNKNLKTE